MSDPRGPYRVYYLNRFVKKFADRDAALGFVYSQANPEDFEVLDGSDA